MAFDDVRRRAKKTPGGSSANYSPKNSFSKQVRSTENSSELKNIGLSKRAMQKLRMGVNLDIETTTLFSHKNSVLQIGISRGHSYFEEYNIRQQKDFKLSPFLSEHSSLKEGEFFRDSRTRELHRDAFKGMSGKIVSAKTRTDAQDKIKDMTYKMLKGFKQNKENIYIFNANFELDHLSKFFGGKNPISFSSEFLQIKKSTRNEETLSRRKFQRGEIDLDTYSRGQFDRQAKIFKQITQEIERPKGSVIDVMEIGRYLSSLAQQKGLIPNIGNVAIGNNVETLIKIFFNEDIEFHRACSDTHQQARVLEQMLELINKISDEKIPFGKYESVASVANKLKQIGVKEKDLKYFKHWGSQSESELLKALVKKIQNETEVIGHIERIRPGAANETIMGSRTLQERNRLFQKALSMVDVKTKNVLNALEMKRALNLPPAQKGFSRLTSKLNVPVLAAGGFLVASAFKNNLFSGFDDEANTIEGMAHSWAGNRREIFTDFGSGYKGPKSIYYEDAFGAPVAPIDRGRRSEEERRYQYKQEDPTSNSYSSFIVPGGLYGVGRMAWNRPIGVDAGLSVDDFSYIGKIDANKTTSEILGRKQATIGDVIYSTVKRIEGSLMGFPKFLGIGDLMGSSYFHNASFSVNIGDSSNATMAKYLEKITKRNLLQEGITEIAYRSGNLYAKKGNVETRIPGSYGVVQSAYDLNQNQSPTKAAMSLMRNEGFDELDPKKNPFLIYGSSSENPLSRKLVRANGYIHETMSKFLMLMDDPFEALAEITPDIKSNKAFNYTKNLLRRLPKMGVGGTQNLKGSVLDLTIRHSKQLAKVGLIGAGIATINSFTKDLAAEGSIGEKAGILGYGAAALKTGHLLYSNLSEMTGLTSLREWVEDKAPGMSGWDAALGVTLSSGLMAAGFTGVSEVLKEASGGGYASFISSKVDEIHEMPGILKNLPGLGGKYTNMGRSIRTGGIVGAALALPFWISGLGSSQRTEEWEKEYEGTKEVAVRSGRFWEMSMEKWEGGKIDYYRPNWYARMMDDADTELYYGGDNISPLGAAIRSFFDPYWLEKRHWNDMPYGYAGPDGSNMGLLGPMYEMTIGAALKRPTLMHASEFNRETGNRSDELNAPVGLESYLSKQWFAATEAFGLRGFMAASIKERITGEHGFGQYDSQYESSADMNNFAKRYQDLQIGGGVMTTEAFRRLMPKEHSGSIDKVNGLMNDMPSWLPGGEDDYHLDFRRGNPYSKIKEGYYRLPGKGLEARYEELKGLDPEDYPDIYKFKVLADVAPGSSQYNALRGKLQNASLQGRDLQIFEEAERQTKEKKESQENFRDPRTYDSFLGRYSATLTDVFRANPLEYMLPFSPARKFLPGTDPLTRYKETIIGRDFKSWEHPFEDFIMPGIRVGLSNLGIDIIPEGIEDRRKLDAEFDKLQAIKATRLAKEAEGRGDFAGAKNYYSMADKTLSSIDPYSDSNAIMKVLPKEERAFYNKFLEAPMEDRREILEMASPQMRELYMAQWDKQLLEQASSGGLGYSQDEIQKIQREVESRATQVRARRKAEISKFAMTSAPGDDWIGWENDVDLRDVKLKHLLNNGKRYHDYGYWTNDIRAVARKPYLDQAARQLTFEKNGGQDSRSNAYNQAIGMGLYNPQVSVLPSLQDGTTFEIERMRSRERDEMLRDMGHIQ